MKANQLPDLETLRRLFYVDDENNLRNMITRHYKALKDELAGSDTNKGYRHTSIYGRQYKNHRIIYALHYGKLPPPDMEIDHRDRDKSNNDPSNLVLVSHRDNANNRGMQRNNTSGIKGVHYHKQTDKWLTRIKIKGKWIHLGYYPRKRCAAAIRAKADQLANTYTGSHESHAYQWLKERDLLHLIDKAYHPNLKKVKEELG